MHKIIFLDIDGTLVNHHGVMPESAKLAVQKARENGHLVFINTGRSKSQLFPEILQVGFDGIIGAAGGYIEIEEEVLFHEGIKKADVQLLVEFFIKHEIDFFLESNNGVFASPNSKRYFQSIIDKMILEKPEAKADIEKGIQPFFDLIIVEDDLIRDDINKVSFFSSDFPLEIIGQEFAPRFTVIPSTVSAMGRNSGELSIQGITKATAIEKLISHLHIPKENTFAYGDGYNDIEMLEFVQHGIAMGNAQEAVKNVANDIADSVDEDGIYNSFKKYGLI
ncbi:HAD family hydrolase [Neobacillus sp. Marseille-QA0830]